MADQVSRVGLIEHRCRAHASVETGDCAVCLRISRDKLAELADELVIERNEAREQHQGAVEDCRKLREALTVIRDALEPDDPIFAIAAGALAFTTDRGQSSAAGCPACSPDPKIVRPPHTCSGEQS
jgi:hypothetical protein